MNIIPSNIDLYGDIDRSAKLTNVQPSIIEIDLSGPKKSLMELINIVQSVISTIPDDSELIVYFVSGNELTNNDWDGLINYLTPLTNPIRIVYRGTIYPETLKILTNFNDVTIDNDGKFIYIAEKLSIILLTLLRQPEIFRMFLERWIDRYKLIDRCSINLSELQQMGFKFNVLNARDNTGSND